MENIIKKNVTELYKGYSAVYGTEVNRRRMLADVRDGLKLVQRRDVYTMFLKCPSKRVKTATIVGEVLKIHPHGDSSVADSLKLMANWFDCKVPLIYHRSNFGSMQGDNMAATRYTEVQLSKFALEAVIADMRKTKKVVDWVPTFDLSDEEPEYLPAAVPLLLINGTSGIGFGIKCDVPKHNLEEVINATINLIKNPKAPVVLIPDQCMPCEIIDTNWKKICNTGGGNYVCRGIIDVEHVDTDTFKKKYHLNANMIDLNILVIKSTPDGVAYDNGTDTSVKAKIENLAKEGKLPQIFDIIESSKNRDMRIEILLKKGSNPSFVRDVIYKNTEMQKTFHINLQLLEGIDIKRFSYKSYLEYFINFRKLIKFRLYNIKLQNIRSDIHQIEPYIKLLESGKIDDIINMLKKQNTLDDDYIIEYIVKNINITDMQARYIINSNLKSLSIANLKKMKEKEKSLKVEEQNCINMIINENLLMQEIIDELEYYKQTYKEPRKCRVIKLAEVNNIPEGEFKVVVTENNYIKKIGVNETDTNKNDIPKFIFKVDNTDNLLIFTSHGRVYKLPVYKIPNAPKNAPGYDIKGIVKGLTSDIIKVQYESAVKKISKLTKKYFLTIVTRDNCIKNLDLDDIVNAPPSGFIYTKLNDGDIVKDVEIIPAECDVIIYSGKKALRIKCKDINHYKRNSLGVIAMNTKSPIDGIEAIYPDSDYVLVITTNGKINKINKSGLGISERGKAGNTVINLSKGDNIFRILGANDNETLHVVTLNQKIDIPVADIKLSSSISSGQKMIPTKGDRILNCRMVR